MAQNDDTGPRQQSQGDSQVTGASQSQVATQYEPCN